MGETVDAMDRISELPPSIIHHIMSYLGREEVAQLSILSKRWNCVRKSFPIFDFDQSYFTKCLVLPSSFSFKRKSKHFCERLNKFIKFVDDSLLQFSQLKLSIQKFHLQMCLHDVEESSSLVDKWVGLAVENEAKEFDIQVITDSQTKYTLPQIIFSAKLITTLKLSGCKLELPSGSIRFRSLKNLSLKRICINEEVVEKLTSECPLLEQLSFDRCWGLKCFCLSKPLRLKIIEIFMPSDELGSVVIDASSLQQFMLSLGMERPFVFDIAGCPNLNMLELTGVRFTDERFLHLVSKFPLLEYLYVYGCSSLERIKISSNQLKILQFRHCPDLKAVKIDTPNLFSFTYKFNPIPNSSIINAPCPWIVNFCIYGDRYRNSCWLLNLKEFLRVSNQIEELGISVELTKNPVNLDKLRESSLSLPCQVGNLKLDVDVPLSFALLDIFLWICFPRTLWVTEKGDCQNFFKLLLEITRICRDAKCCNSHHIKCWWHYLKEIKIEGLFDEQGQKLLDKENLMEGWTNFAQGMLQLNLDWCFPLLTEKT